MVSEVVNAFIMEEYRVKLAVSEQLVMELLTNLQTLQSYLTQEALSDNSELMLRDSDVGIPTWETSPCKLVYGADLTLRDGPVGIPTPPSLPCKLVYGDNLTLRDGVDQI